MLYQQGALCLVENFFSEQRYIDAIGMHGNDKFYSWEGTGGSLASAEAVPGCGDRSTRVLAW